MKKSKLPIIKLNKEERLWLQEVYEYAKKNKRPTYQQIRSKLDNKLSRDFRPSSINTSLVSFQGEEIKLLGVIALEGNTSVIPKIDTVIYAIRDLLIKNPDVDTINIREVAETVGMTVSEVGFLLNLARDIGSFYRGASYEEGLTSFNTISIGNDTGVYYEYIGFKGIEDILLKRTKPAPKKAPKKEASSVVEQKPVQSEGMIVKPIFKNISIKLNPKLCFVLMPFKYDWSSRIYTDFIRKNIEDSGLQCLRADDLTGTDIITDIWTGINQAAVIIADVTGTNGNVMYELGIVHTLGKPCILMTQEINNIPFDFRHLRHIDYRDNTDGIKIFDRQFKKHLQDIYKTNYTKIKLENKVD